MRLEGFQSQSEFVRQAEGQAKSCLERIEKAEKKSMGTQEDGHETEPHICGWSMIWNY